MSWDILEVSLGVLCVAVGSVLLMNEVKNDTVPLDVLCVVVGSVLLMDEVKNDTVPLLSNGGQDVAISMDGDSGDKQRYQQQLQLIDEQVMHCSLLLTPSTFA